MSRMRRLSLLWFVGLPALTVVTAVGCRSSQPAPAPLNTREPPIAAQKRQDDSIVLTSATEAATPCTH